MPAAAVIPSLTAFSYAVAVETLVASGRTRATVRKAERSRQVRCTGQRRTAGLVSLTRDRDETEGAAERAVFAGDG